MAGLLAIGLASPALADRAFTARFSTNANGDIAIVGNTLESCQTSVADCANARAGAGSLLNNNNFSMARVNVEPTTLDSSSARLSLPVGARVLFAGLYYGARTNAGTGGKAAPDPSAAGVSRVDLRPPGASGFERLTAAVDQSSEVTGAYGAFADVTGQVQRAGSGVYTVANVQAATGEDRYAGWALVVAYEAAGEPPRNLTVFDGLQSVTQSKPAVTIPVSGFQTPLSGPVRTKLGFVAYEGDRGLTGDSATLNGRALSDRVTPANNFFDSAISTGGQNVTDKTPDYVNQLGFDAKLIGIDGFLANGATSANIALRTSSDQYLPARPHLRHRSLRPRDPSEQDRREPDAPGWPDAGGGPAALHRQVRQRGPGGGDELRGHGQAAARHHLCGRVAEDPQRALDRGRADRHRRR